ncbi:MAG TPA: DNA topoisomerase, partial [Polyangia bacterium]
MASLATEERQEKPRPPFQATSWLQVAQKALGLSVKDATAATQALFETGCTTYPRTDSVRVAEDAVAWARREIARRFGAAFVPPAPWEHRDRGDVQGAHEAIRPTLEDDATALKARATGQWGDAYALIEARFLASQAASRRMKRTEALLVGGDQRFLAVGDVEVFPGWRKILGTDAKEEEAAASKAPPKQEAEKEAQSSLPKLSEGESVEVSATEVLEITTKPKPLFSQAGLVAELERRGIGRPSTYHSVVPLITKRGWVEERVPEQKKGGGRKRLPVLVPTALGIDLCDFLNTSLPGLVNYEFTAELEKALDDVEHGRRSRLEVGQQWWKRFALELAAAQKLPARRVDSPDLGPCSRCLEEGRQGRLRLVEGKRKDGTAFRFAGCDADSKTAKVCGFTAPVDSRGRVLNGTPCEVCAEVMRPVERRDGGHSLVCRKDGWFLADREWRLVRAPKCSSCTQSMVHRERSESRGKFFWACFADSVFADSDQFGRVSEFRGKGANG